VPGLAVRVTVVRATAVMVTRLHTRLHLEAGTGIVLGAPVHASPLHDLHGEEEGHGHRGEAGAEGPRGTGQHGTMIEVETG
jgi:hypothetical protein